MLDHCIIGFLSLDYWIIIIGLLYYCHYCHYSKVLEACSAAVEVRGLHGISRRLHSNSNSQCLLFYTVIPDFKIPSICKPLFKDQSY